VVFTEKWFIKITLLNLTMINLDGSHESWLIYSDWLEDQDDSLCHQIRSDLEDDINNWIYEYRFPLGVGGGFTATGGFSAVGVSVGGGFIRGRVLGTGVGVGNVSGGGVAFSAVGVSVGGGYRGGLQ
jgi:hypothetical protein